MYFPILKPKSPKLSTKIFVLAFSHIWPRRKTRSRSNQGHNSNNPDSTQVHMQHTKLKTISQLVQEKTVFTVYGYGGHFDHLTWAV